MSFNRSTQDSNIKWKKMFFTLLQAEIYRGLKAHPISEHRFLREHVQCDPKGNVS